MNRPRFFIEDTCHHLYNRGVNKETVFFDLNDYYFFQRRLSKYKLKYSIKILCYCLMPNHFHLFIMQTLKSKPINKFISDLMNSYTNSINKKYKRSGVLFEGVTKSKIIYNENTFPELTRYILLNPVRANLCSSFQDYEFSSAKEFMNICRYDITDDIILHYFADIERFKEYILDNK